MAIGTQRLETNKRAHQLKGLHLADGNICNRMEVVPRYCLDEFVEEMTKDTMGSMVGLMVATTLYG
jgi:hypothetical protein